MSQGRNVRLGENSEDKIIQAEMDENIDSKRKWWGIGRKKT